MWISIKEKYFVTAIYTDSKGGFSADIEAASGKSFRLDYSNITNKFYKNGENAKLPQYLCKAALDMAISKGICFLSELDKANVYYWLKK